MGPRDPGGNVAPDGLAIGLDSQDLRVIGNLGELAFTGFKIRVIFDLGPKSKKTLDISRWF